HGSSFVMAAQFTGDPNCPVDTRTILTYSQSTNPNSPYSADQTRMFSRKEWKDEAFSEGGDGYPRPLAASPVQVSLVPAYDECTTGANRTHGPPLVFPSCNPPAQTSGRVTVGTFDANGAAPKFVGSVRLGVHVGQPGPPDDSDVLISAALTDLRCTPGQDTATCGDPNAVAGGDYTGELQAVADLRLTDKFNGTGAEGGTDPATVADFPFPVTLPCTGTPDDKGGSCGISTSLNALTPGAVTDGKRAVMEIGQLRVDDGGQDGVAATQVGNRRFAVQGVFVP